MDLALLGRTQQLGLDAEWKLADLVEHEPLVVVTHLLMLARAREPRH